MMTNNYHCSCQRYINISEHFTTLPVTEELLRTDDGGEEGTGELNSGIGVEVTNNGLV